MPLNLFALLTLHRHLNACQLVELFPGRPALLIADAMGALAPSVDAARRDVELLGRR